MRIPRIDMWVLGYRVFTFRAEDVSAIANLLLKNGFNVRFFEFSVKIPERDVKRVVSLLSDKFEYEISETRGALGVLFRFLRRRGAVLALAVFGLLFLFLSSVIWDVRIEGVDYELKKEIEASLYDSGLQAGRLWSTVDKNEIENRVLQSCDKISWLNINRRGTVAYISAVERLDFEDKEKPTGYANIVAERDCIIEEIRVKSGYPLVKVGDTVRKGQILISGAYPAEMGGGFCYAEGIVIGRYSDLCEVSVAKNDTEKRVREKKTVSFSIKIFGISLKLYKNYRNLDGEYVIIENEEVYSLLGGRELPISSLSETLVIYENFPIERSDAETVNYACEKMQNLLLSELRDKTLLKLKTDAGFTDSGYKMTSYYTCQASVGRVLEFEAERK